MRESWTPKEDELGRIAATVPLVAAIGVMERTEGRIVSEWRGPETSALDLLALGRLLPSAQNAMAPVAPSTELSLTVASASRSAVVTELGTRWIVVFGFREAVSYDWASYYVRRALGLMRRRELS